MAQYAQKTDVSTAASRDEIERTLARYGADQFLYGWDDTCAVIGFRIANRQVKVMLPIPDRNSRQFTHTPERGTKRAPEDVRRAWEQACRQRWRALALVIKAKLEAVESGISTVEREFLSDIVLPNGQTVSALITPQIARAYETREMPALLPSYDSAAGLIEAQR